MPTKHRRVSVTVDPDLADALRQARADLGGDVADATLIRDLALRGAETLGTMEENRQRLLYELAYGDWHEGFDMDAHERLEQQEERELLELFERNRPSP